MTLSRESSAVMRGEGLDRLPIATLVGQPRAGPRSNVGHRVDVDVDGRDRGPTTDELVSDAYQAGFTEGVAAAEAAVRNDVALAVAALEASMTRLDQSATTWEQSGPQEALELALHLAEVILMREVACSDAPGRYAILRCFSEIDRGETAVVRLHPSDIETLVLSTTCWWIDPSSSSPTRPSPLAMPWPTPRTARSTLDSPHHSNG